MKHYRFAALALTFAIAPFGESQVITFADRTLFQHGLPALQTVDFETGNIESGAYSTIQSPLDSATNSHWFLEGSIAEGVRFSSLGFEPNQMGLLLWGDELDGHGNSKELGTAQGWDSLVISFLDTNTTYVGFDYRGFYGSGTATISLFGMNNELIELIALQATKAPAFFGAHSSLPLSKVTFQTTGFHFGVDDVTFGEAAAVPAPGAALVMILTGLNTYRKRKKKSR